MQEKIDGARLPYRTDWERAAQWSYQDEKNLHWQEWGFISADETEYQRKQREAAQSKVRELDRRIVTGKITMLDAMVIVREELRNTRSPSKRPVYAAWLKEKEELVHAAAVTGS